MTYNYKNIGITLLIAAIILIIISISSYVYVFHENNISNVPNDWAIFGSYVGGVVGGIITPLALVGAVLALFQQHDDSLKNKKQILAGEILKTIERTEDSIDKELKEKPCKINYVDADHYVDCTAFSILTNPFLFKAEEGIPIYIDDSKKLYDESLPKNEMLSHIEFYGLIAKTVGKLNFMEELIKEHKNLTGNNIVALFYKKKYKYAVGILIKRGYPLNSWDQLDSL